MCKAEIKNWWQTILPTSVFFQTIVIFLTLVAGGIFDIGVRYFLDFFNHSFSPWRICWAQGWSYLHDQQGVQIWAPPVVAFVFAVVVYVLVKFINRANRKQKSMDVERENTLQNAQRARDGALTASLDRLSANIERLISTSHTEIQDDNQKTNEATTQDNQT